MRRGHQRLAQSGHGFSIEKRFTRAPHETYENDFAELHAGRRALFLECFGACFELFLGAYPDQVLVFDDAKGVVEKRIQLSTGLPTSLSISMDKKTIYATTNDHDGIEVIDVATRRVTSHFVLDTATTKYRLNGATPDPTGKLLYASPPRSTSCRIIMKSAGRSTR